MVNCDSNVNYRFFENKNTACISCVHVVKYGHDIKFISHDLHDGCWQFLCGNDHSPDMAMVVGLGEAANIDPTINEAAALPLGYIARRDKRGLGWKIEESAQQVDSAEAATND